MTAAATLFPRALPLRWSGARVSLAAGAELLPEFSHLLVETVGQRTERQRRVAERGDLLFHTPKGFVAARQLVTF